MLNQTFIMGRLARDPEVRHTQSGVTVCSFTLAVDRDFKDKETGERRADFINVVAWKQTAEFVSRYFRKGRMAVVEGRLQMREYTDKDGKRRTVAEVVAEHIYFGDSEKDAVQKAEPSYQPAQAGGFEELQDDEGELPF